MKQMLQRAALALALTALVSGAARADVTSKNVRFHDNLTVGGTLVKKGTYKVSFNDQTSELTISRGGKVIAKTTARLEEYKSTGFTAPDYRTRQADGTSQLTSVKLGSAYAIVGAGGSGTAAQEQP